MEGNDVHGEMGVVLYVIKSNGTKHRIGTAITVKGNSMDGLLRTMHGSKLSMFQKDGTDLVAIFKCDIEEEREIYPYCFGGVEGPPELCGGMYHAGTYAWDKNMMAEIVVPSERGKDAENKQAPAPQQSTVRTPPPPKRRTFRKPPPSKRKHAQTTTNSASGAPTVPQKKRKKNAGQKAMKKNAGAHIESAIIEIPDSDDEHEAGEEVELAGVPDVCLKDYQTNATEVALHDIDIPEYTTREFSTPHVQTIYNSIHSRGWKASAALIIVTPREPRSSDGTQSLPVAPTVSKSASTPKFWVVDGVHRLLALRMLVTRFKERKKQFSRINVLVVKHASDSLVSPLEIVALGLEYNQTASTVLKTSFLHRVQSSVSVAKLLLKLGYDLKTLSVRHIQTAMRKMGMFSSDRQEGRYSLLGYAFARCTEGMEVLKDLCDDVPSTGAAHLCHRELLTLPPQGLVLVLQGLASFLRNSETRISFRTIEKNFYATAIDLYKECMRLAGAHGMSVQDFLAEKVVVAKNRDPISIRELYKRQMTRYEFASNKEKLSKRNTARKVVLHTTVTKHFAHSEPTPQQPGTPLASLRRSTRSPARFPVVPHYSSEVSSPARRKSTRPRRRVDTSQKHPPEPCQPHTANIEASPQNRKNASVAPAILELQAQSESLPITVKPQNKKPPTVPPPTPEAPKVADSIKKVQDENSVREAAPKVSNEQENEEGEDYLEEDSFVEGEGEGRVRDSIPKAANVADGEEQDDMGEADRNEEVQEGKNIASRGPYSRLFLEVNPQRLPVGCVVPATYVDGAQKSSQWTGRHLLPPSAWPQDWSIPHVTPWLETLSLGKSHRSHLFCTVDDLATSHKAVFFHAARARARDWHQNEELKKREAFASEYFAMQRVRVDEVGYTTFDGFLLDKPGEFLPDSATTTHDTIGPLIDEVNNDFLDQEVLKADDSLPLFELIRNEGAELDELNRSKGIGRFRTTTKYLLDLKEEDPDNPFAQMRARLDARIAQVVAGLRLQETPTPGSNYKLRFPDNGGRFLITRGKQARQTPHIGFPHPFSARGHDHLGYFVLCSGTYPFPVLAMSHSHKYTRLSVGRQKYINQGLYLEKIIVPPHSIFLCRGDVYYAGAGYNDAIGLPGHGDDMALANCSYHMYLIPERQKLEEWFQLVSTFEPCFFDSPRAQEMTEGKCDHELSDSESSEPSSSEDD